MKKKITKLTKIFLLFVTIFSQLGNVTKVLAEEITSKPLLISLNEVVDETSKKYEFTYISKNKDYEETEVVDDVEVDKLYDIELTSTFTYLDNTTSDENKAVIEDITGKSLNSTRGSYKLDPISILFNGIFNLNIKVYDNENIIYEDNLSYEVSNNDKGLKGNLNNGEVLPLNESIGLNSVGEYTISSELGKEYIQNLKLLPGGLSPSREYRVTCGDTVEVLTGTQLSEKVFTGTTTDLTNKFAGEYNYKDDIIIEELNGEEVLNTYNYTYSSTIKYGEDNDEYLKELYNLNFVDGYLLLDAIDYNENKELPNISDIVESLSDDITLEIEDNNGNLLDLTSLDVLNSPLKNDYILKFTNGTTASYTVVVTGDATYDNTFSDEDLLPTIESYLNDEKLYSMDIVESEEFGLINFEDILLVNDKLKENNTFTIEANKGLNLSINTSSDEFYVGDTLEVNVLVESENVGDYINGMDAFAKSNDNIRLENIKFNDILVGTYNDEGHLVGVGGNIKNGDNLLTLTFTAISEGTGTVDFSGSIAKSSFIDEFDNLTKEVTIIRKISTNNNLESLNASVGTFDIEFAKDVTNYTLTVPYDTKSVILSGALEDIYSSVSGLIEYELTEDETVANVIVYAEDGSSKTYTINIVKEKAKEEVKVTPITYYYSSNNYLKSLEIKDYSIDFNKYVNEYSIKVDNSVSSLDITALAEHSGARVEITGNENFEVGENTVTIKVTAENGNTREYKILVEKEEAKDKVVSVEENTSSTVEKVIIIVLIILVVLGLLYLIFKKDENENIPEVKKDDNKKTSDNKKRN